MILLIRRTLFRLGRIAVRWLPRDYWALHLFQSPLKPLETDKVFRTWRACRWLVCVDVSGWNLLQFGDVSANRHRST